MNIKLITKCLDHLKDRILQGSKGTTLFQLVEFIFFTLSKNLVCTIVNYQFILVHSKLLKNFTYFPQLYKANIMITI